MRTILLLLISLPAFAAYDFSGAFVVDHTQVPNTDQTNFPVTISGTYTWLKTVANGGKVKSTCNETVGSATVVVPCDFILSSDSAGVSLYSWEIAFWDATTGQIEAHVSIPTLSHTADATIYYNVGNVAIVAFQGNVTGTWNANYILVHHFFNGTTLSAADSTNQHNGTAHVGGLPTATAGQIDGGVALNGTSDYFDDANNVTLGSGAITLEVWANRAWSVNKYTTTVDMGAGASSGISFLTSTGGTANIWVAGDILCYGIGYNGPVKGAASPGALTDNTWHHIVCTMNSTTTKIYLDGVALTMRSASGNSVNNPNVIATIGGSSGGWSDGKEDEIRVSSVALSADWIATQYNNQKAGSTFYSVTGPNANSPSTTRHRVISQ